MCRSELPILTLNQTEKCHFSHRFSDLTSEKLCYHLERQQKRFLKIHFEFPYSSFFFYSEGNRNDKYLHTLALVVSSKIIPNSRPKWAKSIPVFRPKPGKNPTFCGCTYLQGLCKGVTPPPRHQRELYESQETRSIISWPLTFARGMPSLLHFSHTTGYAGHSFSW